MTTRTFRGALAASLALALAWTGGASAQVGGTPAGGATAQLQQQGLSRLGEVQASPTANTVLDRLKALKTEIAALEALVGEVQASPTANTVLDRLKTLHTDLVAISGYVDGLETAASTEHADLLAIDGHVDGLEAALGTVSTTLTAIAGSVDGLEASATAANTKLDTLHSDLVSVVASTASLETKLGEVQAAPTANTVLDRLKTLHADIAALQALVGEVQASPTANTVLERLKAVNTNLTTIAGYVDGLETAAATQHADLLAIDGHVDQLEGYVDQLEGYVDGIEALIGATNTKLDTLHSDLAAMLGVSDLFAPGTTTPLSLSTSSARATLPAGAAIAVLNSGSVAAEIKLGNSAVTAATTDMVIPPGAIYGLSVGANTHLAGIVASGTGSLSITGGSGRLVAALSSTTSGGGGDASASNQLTGNASLASIDTKLTSQATGSKQDTGNTSLASIDTKLTSQATGTKQDTGNASLASLEAKVGEVQAAPTANTLLDRVKALKTEIAALEALVGEVQASPTANTVQDRLKSVNTNLTTLAGYLDGLEGQIGEVQASPTANTVLDRLKTINTSLTTIAGYVDQLEGYVDGIEALITSSNTKLDTLHSDIGTTNTNVGAPGSTACASDTGSCSLNAQFQRALQALTTAIAKLDAIKTASESTAPTNVNQKIVDLDGTTTAISISSAATTELKALTSGKRIWVTAWDVNMSGGGTWQWVYGTGTACGTGQTTLSGAYDSTTAWGIARGNGSGAVMTVPAGKALCAITTGTGPWRGSVQTAVEP